MHFLILWTNLDMWFAQRFMKENIIVVGPIRESETFSPDFWVLHTLDQIYLIHDVLMPFPCGMVHDYIFWIHMAGIMYQRSRDK
jgi:hypothetical protein